MTYTLGSLFDGSGGFPLAGSLCGITPLWSAEVEPYPIAVTRSRFPQMKHLGDVTKINGAEIEPVDIITFGSPCQDLSVAGKRAGLKHEANGDNETTRSGLFMEAVRIIKEMRNKTNGDYPTFVLWENVPGAFSSNNGEDFRTVLEELIKIAEPQAVMPAIPQSGWAYADSYCGDGWSIAYRVFDAQYWGVPQRRRRIHLVVDFRGQRAGKILFERDGVRGYFAQSGTPRQAAAADAERSTGADDRAAAGFDGYNGNLTGNASATLCVNCRNTNSSNGVVEILPNVFCKSARARSANDATTWKYGTVANTLNTFDLGETRVNELVVVPAGFKAGQGAQARSIGWEDEKCVAYSFDSLASNSMKSKNPHSGCRRVEIAKTLDTTDPNPSKNQGGIAIVCVKCYDARGNGDGKTVSTITGDHENRITDYTSDRPAVVYALDRASFNQGANAQYDFEISDSGINSTVVAKGPSAVCYCIGNGQADQTDLYEKAGTLNCIHDQQPVCICAKPHYIVRRLTPTECARLQGFSDRWGEIDEKTSFTPEEYEFWLNVRNTHAAINGKKTKNYTEKQMLTWYNKLHTDSAEYKMWGNGIALPPALYCMQGIVDAIERSIT